MSDAGAAPAQPALFGRLALGIAAAAAIGFAAFVLLIGFADDWRSGNDGGAHALSNSALGFSGIAALVAAREGEGAAPIVRDAASLAADGLLVLTPPPYAGPDAIAAAIEKRGRRATLVILPKWAAVPDPSHRGWVLAVSPLERFAVPEEIRAAKRADLRARDATAGEPAKPPTLAEKLDGDVKLVRLRAGARLAFEGRGSSLPAPPQVQTIKSEHLEPLLVTGAGAIVLGKVRDEAVFVLADPDLLNNQALKSLAGAERALSLLDQLPASDAVSFDVMLNGFTRSPNLVKLAFQPPFLPMTLALIGAAMLAAAHAAVRFGPAAGAAPPIHPFGVRGLIESSAVLIRQAGREPGFAVRYARLVRDLMAERGIAADAEFDRLHGAAAAATTPAAALAAARALHQWKENQTHDR